MNLKDTRFYKGEEADCFLLYYLKISYDPK